MLFMLKTVATSEIDQEAGWGANCSQLLECLVTYQIIRNRKIEMIHSELMIEKCLQADKERNKNKGAEYDEWH